MVIALFLAWLVCGTVFGMFLGMVIGKMGAHR